jgi:hypothetical protein
MQKPNFSTFGAAFLDGFSMAGLLEPLRRPGAPTQVFPDETDALAAQAGHDLLNSEQLEEARRMLVSAGFEVRPRKAGSVH